MSKLDDQWEKGEPHSKLTLAFIAFIKSTGIDDELDLKFGGDGDNGENLAIALDLFSARQEAKSRKDRKDLLQIENLVRLHEECRVDVPYTDGLAQGVTRNAIADLRLLLKKCAVEP